jgi:hypothetical protein
VSVQMEKELHYKSEKALKFSDYLTKAQTMFEIYEEAGEPWADSKKLRFLTQTVKAAHLSVAIQGIKADEVKGNVTYTEACNLLAKLVSDASHGGIEGFRQVSAAEQGKQQNWNKWTRGGPDGGRGRGRDGGRGGRYGRGGRGGRDGRGGGSRGGRGGRGRGQQNDSSSHAYIPDKTWNSLSYAQRDAIHKRREADNVPQSVAVVNTVPSGQESVITTTTNMNDFARQLAAVHQALSTTSTTTGVPQGQQSGSSNNPVRWSC